MQTIVAAICFQGPVLPNQSARSVLTVKVAKDYDIDGTPVVVVNIVFNGSSTTDMWLPYHVALQVADAMTVAALTGS